MIQCECRSYQSATESTADEPKSPVSRSVVINFLTALQSGLMLRKWRNCLAVFLLMCSMSSGAQTGDYPINKNWRSIAIKGYDPVAYFTQGEPVKGKSKFEYNWQGARWRFASEAHRKMFAENPEKYAPRYGGNCAEGMSLGRIAPVDPKAWIIVDGALFLNYDVEVRDQMASHPQQTIDKADKFWSKIEQILEDP